MFPAEVGLVDVKSRAREVTVLVSLSCSSPTAMRQAMPLGSRSDLRGRPTAALEWMLASASNSPRPNRRGNRVSEKGCKMQPEATGRHYRYHSFSILILS
jgi:hypothetical protein